MVRPLATTVASVGCVLVCTAWCSAAGSRIEDARVRALDEMSGGLLRSRLVTALDESGVRTDRIVVQLRSRSAAGLLTSAAEDQDDSRLRGLMDRWGVTGVSAAVEVAPRNADLAAATGIDRFYCLEVPVGTDTVRAAREFGELVDLFAAAEPDPVGVLHTPPTDALYIQQWSLNNTGQVVGGVAGRTTADIDWLETWEAPHPRNPIVIAVLDTGCSMSHPDLQGQYVSGWCTVCSPQSSATDDSTSLSHGTFCAGIAAARTNNAVGIAGAAPDAKIMPIKVSNGLIVTQTTTGNGLIWAADHGASIASMSWGFGTGTTTTFLRSAADYAGATGMLMVSSTGNTPGSAIGAPARWPDVIAVGATNNVDGPFIGGTTGPELDMVAPGVDILTTADQSGTIDGYRLETGTSMAVPMVAGAAAVIWAIKPTLQAGDVREILQSTAVDLGTPGWDSTYGMGRLNVHRAMLATIAIPPPCASDLTGDGVSDLGDLFLFLQEYFATVGQSGPNLLGDFDRNGTVSVEDLFLFMSAWFAGC